MREVFLYTNQPRFYGDLSEIIRIFIDDCTVTLTDAQNGNAYDLFVCCSLGQGIASATFVCENRTYTHTEAAPLPDAQSAALEEKRAAKRFCKHSVFLAMQQAFDFVPPWGCLTGIRPTKMLRDLCEKQGMEAARAVFGGYYRVSPQKLELAEQIVRVQRPIIQSVSQWDFDLYVGIPFCTTRCAYCSFAAYEVGKGCATSENRERYVALLEREIEQNVALVRAHGYRIRSVYIGGGTPTALTCAQLQRILDACLRACDGFGLEFTVEAGRPDTIDREKLQMLKAMGVNRISINPQSMNEQTLKRIGRAHDSADIFTAYALARAVGFDCINMDTIIGLPGETQEMVAYTVEQLVGLAPENLTVHTLAIKRSSRIKESLTIRHSDEYCLPSDQTAAQMLEISMQGAAKLGMEPYYMYRQKYMRGSLENIGFGLPGKHSIYNIDMMEETASVLALGAGAISKWLFGGSRLERIPNPKDLLTYFEKSEQMYAMRKALLEK